MGHDLQTPLLHPSAPPLQSEPAYPQIPAPGVQPALSGYPAPSVMGIPADLQQHHQQHMPAPPVLMAHPSQAPPPQMVHVHMTDDPHLSCLHAAPRWHVCPACNSQGHTQVKRESGFCAWATAFFMCWVCCPLFWLPFCLDCDRDLVHRCSVCGTEIVRVQPWNQ